MKTGLILILVTLLILLSSGINYATFPVILESQNVSNMLIGIAMSFEIIAMLLLYSKLAIFIQKLGLAGTVILLSCSRCLAIALLANNEFYIFWLSGIFIYGAATGMLIVLIQTWLSSLQLGKYKGVLIGLFTCALSSGIAFAPVVLNAVLIVVPSIDTVTSIESSKGIYPGVENYYFFYFNSA
ncbi:MAG: hypothetical protein HRU38_19545 [Saccharospirillaceae bacterium]|nr:hypothetical protein [Pseudomonadales bacterium]NRB80832.1 hypothetical protein [Saccharospirillaceae bacterium]